MNEVQRPMVPPSRGVLAFRHVPAAYMDSSWWQTDWLPVRVFERLRGQPRSRRRLSSFVVRELALGGDVGVVDPASAEGSLAVMDSGRLRRLVVLAGVTLLSGAITRILRGDDRRRVKDAIGVADYEFAVKRGRLVLRQARLPDIAGVRLEDPAATRDASGRLGMGALAAALQQSPPAFARRVQLKLPRGDVEGDWVPLTPQADEFLRFFRLLDRQVAPA